MHFKHVHWGVFADIEEEFAARAVWSASPSGTAHAFQRKQKDNHVALDTINTHPASVLLSHYCILLHSALSLTFRHSVLGDGVLGLCFALSEAVGCRVEHVLLPYSSDFRVC